MKGRLLALAVVLTLVPGCARETSVAWEKEPTSFKGIKFGSSEKYVKEKIANMFCVDSPDPKFGDRGCTFNDLEIGDVSTKGNISFKSDKMFYISLKFEHNDYSYLKEIFITRYGKPTVISRNTLSNAMGAKFEKETLLWKGEHIYLKVANYSDKITEGNISFITKTEFESYRTKVKKGEKRAAEDL